MNTNTYTDGKSPISDPASQTIIGSARFWYGPDPEGKLFFQYDCNDHSDHTETENGVTIINRICEIAFKRECVKALVTLVWQEKDVPPLMKNGFVEQGCKPSMCGNCGTTLVFMRKKTPDLSLTVANESPEPICTSNQSTTLGEYPAREILFNWYFNPRRMMA